VGARGGFRWAAAAAILVAAGLAALPAATLAAPAERPANDLTRYVAALRQAVKLGQAAASAGTALSGKDCTRFGPAAARLADAADAANTVFAAYAKAKTRYGTEEEIRLFGTLASDLVDGSRRLTRVAGETGVPSAQEQKDAEREVGIFWSYLAQRIQDRLEIAGLADVLTSQGFREIKTKVVTELKQRLKTRAEAELRRLVGFRVKLDVPLKEQIHDFLQAELRRSLAKLALAAGPAGIVVRLFGGQVVSWIGAKLKEALREKGHLEKRVGETIDGFKAIEARIAHLAATADIDTVRRVIHQGQAALGATGFLKGDLKRAGSSALLADLAKAEKIMQAYVDGTRFRFLLDSPLLGEDFKADAGYAAKIAADARRLAKKLGCPLAAGGGGGTSPTTKGNLPTKGSCLPVSFGMETLSSLPPFGVVGTFDVTLGRFGPGPQGNFQFTCAWVTTDDQADAFFAVIDVTPANVGGTAGDCARNRPDDPDAGYYYSRKRHLTVSGGTRLSFTRAAGGNGKILKQVLATAEAQGVGPPC
jgi:hypothetical protein